MEALFEVKNLSVGYDAPLLQDVSFALSPGEVVGILGRNGCGKTTLLRGLSGGIRCFSGQVLVSGRDCNAMPLRQRAACISVLPQHTQVLEGISVRQLLEMGRYPHGSLLGGMGAGDTAIITQTAETLGIAHLLDADCAKLSQGQRQLALLGRLLVQDTPVMLLDEPNAALDYDNTFAMFRILRQVVKQQKKAALLVLHDPELALSQCHRLLIVANGSLRHDLCPAQAGLAATEAALQEIYPHITLKQDPFNGQLRCYMPF